MIPDTQPEPELRPTAVAGQELPRPAAKELLYSEELLGTRREILIKHGDEIYRLRCTRQGKLILHK